MVVGGSLGRALVEESMRRSGGALVSPNRCFRYLLFRPSRGGLERGLNASVQAHELRISWDKVHLWTNQLLAKIVTAGRTLQTEDDLTALGVSAGWVTARA